MPKTRKKRKATPKKEKPIKKSKKEESDEESEESEPEQRTMKEHFTGKAPKSRQKYNPDAKSLQELGYDYDDDLKLVNTTTGIFKILKSKEESLNSSINNITILLAKW